jgi:hypothetical protein
MSSKFTNTKFSAVAAVFLAMATLSALSPAHAGRPLTVDDANVNETGAGHIETWWARGVDGTRSWTVAPAYAPVDGIELGAGIAREIRTGNVTQNIQAKFRITPSQDNGCNVGAVAGYSRATSEASLPYINALFTCNSETLGSLHTNLGALNVSSSKRVRTWGAAWERPYGDVTVHIETFGLENEKLSWATGARFNVLPDLQFDTSLGQTQKQNVVTLGLKWMF